MHERDTALGKAALAEARRQRDRIDRFVGYPVRPESWTIEQSWAMLDDKARDGYAAIAHAVLDADNAWSVGDEIRYDADGALDEVVVRNCHFHLEQMDNDAWWIGLSRHDPTTHIWITLAENGGIEVKVTEDGIGCKEVRSTDDEDAL